MTEGSEGPFKALSIARVLLILLMISVLRSLLTRVQGSEIAIKQMGKLHLIQRVLKWPVC